MSSRPRKRPRRTTNGAEQPTPSVKRDDLLKRPLPELLDMATALEINLEEIALPKELKAELELKKIAELREIATAIEIDTKPLRKKDDIILAICEKNALVDVVLEAKVKSEGFVDVSGVLDLLPEGYGFIRTKGYLASSDDVYVSMSMVRRNRLRKGDYIEGQMRPARDNEKYGALQQLFTINGVTPDAAKDRPKFATLTPIYPSADWSPEGKGEGRLMMEHGKQYITARTIDLIAPIGKGQRGLIVSPPKAGKTTILKDIAAAIHENNPEVHLMCLLVDERPEEVTDMERSIHGEVISSTFDMPSDNHVAVSELVIERAKRLVEGGADVVILLDSITRLARAYNLSAPTSGRILSGGVDSTALYPPKKFFGAARNIEHGGSLTILATALVDTGSKMDEVIFEEFKGTGNMELRLDRSLADVRIFPAIDIISSGTRKEELLLDPEWAAFIWGVRDILHPLDIDRAMRQLLMGYQQTEDNKELLRKMAKKIAQSSDFKAR